MKHAVDLATSILKPKHLSQQVSGHYQVQLENMAKAVLEAEKTVSPLKEEVKSLKKQNKDHLDQIKFLEKELASRPPDQQGQVSK